jgi:replication factor C small subunit
MLIVNVRCLRLLAEKYRPRRLSEIVGQEHVVKHLSEIIARKAKVHMLFTGPPGCGKTSTAYALANELGIPIQEYNASDERGINVIRDKIKRVAFTLGEKIILLDEADNMTDDAQHALRRIMERAERAGTMFILTANEEWRIIEPIKSRCAIFRFRKLTEEEVLKVLLNVLKGEGVDPKSIVASKEPLMFLVRYVDGDLRQAINILETLITSGKTLTVENIKVLAPPRIATRVLGLALEGKVEEAIKTMEDLYISNKLDSRETIEDLYKAIKTLNANPLVKLRLYERLAETERGIKIGCNPVIQLASFLASAYAYSVKAGVGGGEVEQSK